MLIVSDFKQGLPVIIEGSKADIVHADAVGIVAESVLPIGPRDSRRAQWSVPVEHVLRVVVYDVHRDFIDNGSVLCDDCGARVRPRTLESLPEHGCIERQKARADSSKEG